MRAAIVRPLLLVLLVLGPRTATAESGPCPLVAPTELMRKQEFSCRTGQGRTCLALGLSFDLGKDDSGAEFARNPACAVYYYGLACDANARDCGQLGYAYVLGTGAARDPARGRELLERQCAAGDCRFLAQVYRLGLLLPTDAASALRAARASCGQEDLEACEYFESVLPRDCTGEGCTLPRLVDSCAKRLPAACRELGVLYTRKDGPVPFNERRALSLLEAGCLVGDGVACDLAGDFSHAIGRGWKAASKLWLRACSLGAQAACRKAAESEEPHSAP